MSIVSRQNWNLDLSDLVFVEIAIKIKRLAKTLIHVARKQTNNNLSPCMMSNPELKPRLVRSEGYSCYTVRTTV